MSELLYHIHYGCGFIRGTRDGLSRRAGEEQSRMDANFVNEGQLLDLENDDIGEEEDAEDIKLEGTDVVT